MAPMETRQRTRPAFPRIISVDDHTVEPPGVRRDRLPRKYRDTGPRIVRAPLKEMSSLGGRFKPVMGAPGDDGPLGDRWVYEDLHRPLARLDTAVGCDREIRLEVITCEQVRPGSHDVPARLADMDVSHVRSALCFPTFPASAGRPPPRPPTASSPCCACAPTTTGWSRSGAGPPRAAG